MKYRCDHCDEGHKVIDDIGNAVRDILEKRAFPYELLIYALAAQLELAKQTGLELGNKSHRIEMIIQVARNDVINDINKKVE